MAIQSYLVLLSASPTKGPHLIRRDWMVFGVPLPISPIFYPIFRSGGVWRQHALRMQTDLVHSPALPIHWLCDLPHII